MAHAFLSPSSLGAALRCPAKPWLEKDIPSLDNASTLPGSAKHFLADYCYNAGRNADAFQYETIVIYTKPDGSRFEGFAHPKRKDPEDAYRLIVDGDVIEQVQTYLDFVRAIPGEAFTEQELEIEALTGEKGAKGTADFIALNGTVMDIADLKTGYIKVFADCDQLKAYAWAALRQFAMVFEDVETVRMHIVQPSTNWQDTHEMSVAELNAWADETREICTGILMPPEILTPIPGEYQCKFCRAKASCPAIQAQVSATCLGEFQDLTAASDMPARITTAIARLKDLTNDDLARMLPWLDLIHDWANAVLAEGERRILGGQKVAGYKVVAGKKGNRQWSDEAQVAKCLDAAGIREDEAYTRKLISPAQADKVFKHRPDLVSLLAEMVTQAEGKNAVVPVTDKRQEIAVTPTAELFDVIS